MQPNPRSINCINVEYFHCNSSFWSKDSEAGSTNFRYKNKQFAQSRILVYGHPLFTTQTHVTHKCIPTDFYSQFHCTLPYSSAFNFMHPIDAIMHLHIIAHYKSLARFFLSIPYAVIRFRFKFLSLWTLNFRCTNEMHRKT